MGLHVTIDTASQTSDEVLREALRAIDGAQSVLGRNGDNLAAFQLRRAMADVRIAQRLAHTLQESPDAVR